MQSADDGPQERDRPPPAGEDSAFHLRRRLIARARALADEIRERVRRALDQEPGRAPPGTSEPPPSFA
jgi:hypothetical protein